MTSPQLRGLNSLNLVSAENLPEQNTCCNWRFSFFSENKKEPAPLPAHKRLENVVQDIMKNSNELFSKVPLTECNDVVRFVVETYEASDSFNRVQSSGVDSRNGILEGVFERYRKQEVVLSDKEPKAVGEIGALSLEERIKLGVVFAEMEKACGDKWQLRGVYNCLRKEALERKLVEKDGGKYRVGKVDEMTELALSCLHSLTMHPELHSLYSKYNEKIVGLDEVKQQLLLNVSLPLVKPEVAKEYDSAGPNGIILYGPSGCGKTHIAKAIVNINGYKLVEFPKEMSAVTLFSHCQDVLKNERKRCAVIINEDSNSAKVLKSMKECSKYGILVLFLTQFPKQIPKTIKADVIDHEIYVGPPNNKNREELFKVFMKNCKLAKDIDYTKLSGLTNNFVTSEIKDVTQKARRRAMYQSSEVTMQLLEKIIISTKPQLTNAELKKYQK